MLRDRVLEEELLEIDTRHVNRNMAYKLRQKMLLLEAHCRERRRGHAGSQSGHWASEDEKGSRAVGIVEMRLCEAETSRWGCLTLRSVTGETEAPFGLLSLVNKRI